MVLLFFIIFSIALTIAGSSPNFNIGFCPRVKSWQKLSFARRVNSYTQ